MSLYKTALLRFTALGLVWWILTEGDPAGLWFGLAVTVLVTLASLRLFPPSGNRLNPARVLVFSAWFLGQSVAAGLDVTRRLLSPRMPIRPGRVTLTLLLPEGGPRWLLANTLSLMPGTLSVVIEGDLLELHCLDTTQPVEPSVRRAERHLARLFNVQLTVRGSET
jgi:multicomponent Na+:H+ antiporter subunit E